MLAGLVIIVLAGAAAVAAGYVMWWASHRSTLMNICIAMLLGILVLATAVFIGYVMTRVWISPLDRL